MNVSINLLPKKAARAKNEKFLYVSIIFFAIAFFSSISFIAYYYYLSNKLSNIELAQTNTLKQINSLSEKRADLLLIRDRIAAIDKAVSARLNPNPKIEALTRALPNKLELNGFEVGNEKVVARLLSDNLSAFDDFLESKLPAFPQSLAAGVKKIDVTSFGIDNKKSLYYLGLEFNFQDNVQKK